MTTVVKENKEFTQWLGEWIARAQQRRTQTEYLPPHNGKGAMTQNPSSAPSTDASVAPYGSPEV